MTCHAFMDKVYDARGEGPLPLWFRLHWWVHRVWCPDCERELKVLELAQELMETQFFPPAPDFEEAIMEQLCREVPDSGEDYEEFPGETPAGISFRSWVITGLIILFSFSTYFFNMDFVTIAHFQGSSFLIPVGLTIGTVVTGYGALFIGSHLKELSGWFRLH
ncbi:MAG: peptidoglycan-binding protein [Treponema sp.]|jgi:hypothetical protein|nr:peptidoglycan-binding protein [Treponema sp.]